MRVNLWRYVLLLATSSAIAAAASREVVYTSECTCINNHGVARWRAKTDRSEPPADARYIEPVTPSQIYSWIGPGIIPRGGWRTSNEVKWYALTGRVISIGAESDGDVHLVLVDADSDKPGRVVVEVPLGPRWCALRKELFSWTNATFPFTSDWQHQPFHLVTRPVITVVGHAFYDTDHSGADIRNNKRPREKDKAVWEIHPVMQLRVVRTAAVPAAATPAPTQSPLMPTPSIAPAELVTVTQPVTIKIPYGETVIPAGTTLPILSRSATTVRVRYLGDVQEIPISSTNLR